MDEFPPLEEAAAGSTPWALFARWHDEALAAQLPEPEAMTLATADAHGAPSARIVLLRGFDERGFAFYTNYDSRKGAELAANPRAALVLFWPAFNRQVRIEGHIEKTSEVESDTYFTKRPRGHRLGALVSPQSQVIPGRHYLEERMSKLEQEYDGREVPRPPHWGGYRVVPSVIEFWQGRLNRLHDRLRYRRAADGTWSIERLAP